jgi:hypothetical protein
MIPFIGVRIVRHVGKEFRLGAVGRFGSIPRRGEVRSHAGQLQAGLFEVGDPLPQREFGLLDRRDVGADADDPAVGGASLNRSNPAAIL